MSSPLFVEISIALQDSELQEPLRLLVAGSKMNLKKEFKKAEIEDYKTKITKIEKEIKKRTKTKEMWESRLKEKERQNEP